jgi:hypothetical protein
MSVKRVTAHALGSMEQCLVVAAATHRGQALPDDVLEKLVRLPAQMHTSAAPIASLFVTTNQMLDASLQERKADFLRDINRSNMGHFEKEVVKHDAWA